MEKHCIRIWHYDTDDGTHKNTAPIINKEIFTGAELNLM